MKKIILIFFAMLSLVACKNRRTQTGPMKDTDSTTIPAKDNTRAELDTIPQDQSSALSNATLELTEEELKDDAKFDDGSEPTSWETAGIYDVKGLKLFIKNLQHWVSTNQRDSLADAIDFPLRNNKKIADMKTFLDQYDKIMSQEVINGIKTQKLSQIFRNAQGAMVGNIWITDVSEDGSGYFKIISINN